MKKRIITFLALAVAGAVRAAIHTEPVKYKQGGTTLEGFVARDDAIKGEVLVCHGADDPCEKPADLAAFESELRDAQVDWQLIKYGGAVHSFTQPMAGNDNSKSAACNEKADKRSWEAMKQFPDEIFK